MILDLKGEIKRRPLGDYAVARRERVTPLVFDTVLDVRVTDTLPGQKEAPGETALPVQANPIPLQ